jgi:hypothetical protein
LRVLVELISNNVGNDICDASPDVYNYYNRLTVLRCTSTSNVIKFYAFNKSVGIDCVLEGLDLIKLRVSIVSSICRM